MRIASVIGNIVAQGASGGTAPQAVWPGWTSSSGVTFQWWHPTVQTTWATAAFTGSITNGVLTVVGATVYGVIANGAQLFGVSIPAGVMITSLGTGTGGAGTYNISNSTLSVGSQVIMTQAPGAPDYYKVYRDGSDAAHLICGGSVNTAGLQNPGVTASQLPIQGTGTNGRPMAWFTDTTVTAGSSHTYQISGVTASIEGSLSQQLTMTARANVGTILPTLPTNPVTWIQALPNPIVPAVGGTLWLATDNAVGGTNTGWNNPGVRSGNTVTGCGVLFALNNSNINGGDVIVLTGGASYATPTGGAGGFTLPVYTGTNGFTYIISSQTPEYNSSGTLPPDFFAASNTLFQVVTLTAAPAAGATSASLTTAWAQKSGLYLVIFRENDTSGKAINEERQATFTNGSTTIDWHLNNGFYTSPGLTAAATSATILVAYLPGVTPFDNAVSLATVSHASSANGNGFNIPAACSKVRFIGINIQPVVGGPGGNLNFSAGVAMQFTNSTQGNRVVPADSIYIDRCCWGNDPSATGAVSVPHGLAAITCNHLLVKQSYCWLGNYLNHASDSNNYVLGGQFQCWQHNYIACASETVIHGGGYVDQLQIPQDIVFRYNMSHKPASWATTAGFASVGANVKDHFELKAGMRAEIYGNLFLNSLIGAVGGYHYSPFAIECRDQIVAAGLATDQTLCCPWVRVTDVYIHDNQMYNVGTGFYASTADGNPSGFTARVRFSNNICSFNPLNSSAERVTGPRIVGPTQDVMIDHNTFIVNNTNLNVATVGNPWGLEFDIGGLTAGGYYVPVPATEFGWPRFQEGLTITDNIIVVGPNQAAFTNQLSPSVPLFNGYTNVKVTNNLTINDVPLPTVTVPAGNFINATTLANAGLANFQGDSVIPLRPSDWNVVSGTYAKASTTGGPVGAIFVGTLASDPFPRTRWEVIAPSGTTYASAAFQANAAKFNIVDVGPYMGEEQFQGATFATIFQNIKVNSIANGFATPTRCLHYTNSWIAAENTSGNSGTYTQWTAYVNGANWWLRTSYPSGSIVMSPFGGETTNTGVTDQTSSNTVTFTPTGASGPQTFFQAYWYHYDGVLRLGNAVSQGYATNVACAANPFLDGYQMDNIFSRTRVAGAYQMNTTNFAAGNNTANALNQQGQAQQVAALKAINPNLLVMGNADYFINATGAFGTQVALDPSQVGIWDMVYCQAVIGVGGVDGFASDAQITANLILAEAQMAPTGTLIFEQSGPSRGVGWSSTNQTLWTTAEWRAARYGQAWCFMRNWHYQLSFSETYNPTQPAFTDEILTQGGKFGWLGQPVDAPQSASRIAQGPIGIWYRRFQGGVVFWNPSGNGAQTINLTTLGFSGLKAIASNGFGDTTINTGLAVTSITLSDRDGRFLKSF